MIADPKKRPVSGKEGFQFIEVKNRKCMTDFGAEKKVRKGGDSSLMRVRFQGVPLCPCLISQGGEDSQGGGH